MSIDPSGAHGRGKPNPIGIIKREILALATHRVRFPFDGLYFSKPRTAKDIIGAVAHGVVEVATAIRELVAEGKLVKVKGGYMLPPEST